jgi:hypothetical protein
VQTLTVTLDTLKCAGVELPAEVQGVMAGVMKAVSAPSTSTDPHVPNQPMGSTAPTGKGSASKAGSSSSAATGTKSAGKGKGTGKKLPVIPKVKPGKQKDDVGHKSPLAVFHGRGAPDPGRPDPPRDKSPFIKVTTRDEKKVEKMITRFSKVLVPFRPNPADSPAVTWQKRKAHLAERDRSRHQCQQMLGQSQGPRRDQSRGRSAGRGSAPDSRTDRYNDRQQRAKKRQRSASQDVGRKNRCDSSQRRGVPSSADSAEDAADMAADPGVEPIPADVSKSPARHKDGQTYRSTLTGVPAVPLVPTADTEIIMQRKRKRNWTRFLKS